MRSTTIRRSVAAFAAAGLALTLAACGSESTEGGTSATGGDDAVETDETVRIGIPSGWDEGIAVSHLWKAMLEDEGYTVETETADIGVLFTGLAGGGFDLMFDGWLPLTHADYWEDYSSDLTDLGVWYDNAKLTIAVNEDSPAQSLEDLAAMASEYDNRLVGIEAGAGLTTATTDNVIPTYGLEGMDYITSSTPAMLAELSSKTSAGENVAVTLWRPHWAYDAFPIRDLADPEGTLGEAEEIHTFGSADIADRFPILVSWIESFEMTDEQLFEVENMMFNDDAYADDLEGAAAAWLDANPDFVEGITGGSQG
ncbi:glycine/betaine ABC transporter substrate-binding protein [Serinibacter arcticus]|uniref:Glycine/betaine ABC transporter substrate-binding protein n=1 Tax=Serinibacter arcticus TaxID=1655435 RepID=A0A2U1ZYY0_9MICO|nr:glycine betaine ABC transporter substrate-binding protein [Serinibacter arcticus]PWD52133.1 glycine/betaine ABC transporter substrate-binding protein [Serinibacter arcticus]